MKDNIIIPKKILLISISCILAIALGFIGLSVFLNSEFYYNKTSKIKFWSDWNNYHSVEVRSHYYPKENLLNVKVTLIGVDRNLISYVKNFNDEVGIINIIFIDKNNYKIANKEIKIKDLTDNENGKYYDAEFSLKITNNEMKRLKNIEYTYTHLYDKTLDDFKKDFTSFYN